MHDSIYQPDDDSFLLVDCLKDEIAKRISDSLNPDQQIAVLDMGAGSGVVGFSVVDKNIKLTSIDINPEAVKHMQEVNEKEKHNALIIKSNLFENISKQTFDIIVFNTPYLPNEEDDKVHDIALHGGEKGNEVALEFLKQAKHYINDKSTILILVSSLGQPKDIEDYLSSHSFSYSIVGRKKEFFEELRVYKITRLNELQLPQEELNKLTSFLPKDCKDITLLAKGKRGVIFKANYKDQTVAIKVLHPDSDAKNALLLEAKQLEQVNKLHIGPKLIEYDDDYVIMEFIEGELIGDFVENNDEETIMTVFDKVLEQCKTLDKNNINKFEMTNPYKHIIIKNKLEPVLIDFERARFTTRPKNVNQFKEYVRKVNQN